MRKLLLPLSALYAGGVVVRNLAYDHNWFRIKRLPVPVISVGNISVGGSGKTPFVLFLIEKLLAMGRKPGVLSLGYRRLTDDLEIACPGTGAEVDVQMLGDEPALISNSFPNVPVAVQKDRHHAGHAVLEKYEVDVFLLDDGLQNRELHRDLDFVLMTHSLSDLHDSYLPSGSIRDWKGRLRQAGVMVLTAHGGCEPYEVDLAKLKAYTNAPAAGLSFVASRFVDYLGNEFDLDSLKNNEIAAFCGIARPDQFFETLDRIGYSISRRRTFGDHRWYDEYDIDEIFGGDEDIFAVTTAKDAVRIFGDDELSSRDEVKRVYALKEKAVVNFGEQHIDAALSAVFERVYA